MNIPDYRDCGLPVREDRLETHVDAWRHLCSPGAHFTATDRIGMVREARQAPSCALCGA